MRINAAIHGDLNKFMKQQVEAAETAVTKGVKDATNTIKTELRSQVLSAGLGQGVANAWRSTNYPVGKKSINAAGWVYSKVPEIVYAFNYGVVIRSSKGAFLAIPTPSAPKRGTNGKRIDPAHFPESLGKLRFVYRPGKISLLVVDDLRARTGKRGGFRQASASAIAKGRGLTTVVMFFLVPQASMKKKLDVQSAAEKGAQALPDLIIKNWPQEKSE